MTQEQWKNLASYATRGYSDDQLEKIADLCFEADQRGEQAAVWHMAAIVAGNLDRCQCVPCCAKRKAA